MDEIHTFGKIEVELSRASWGRKAYIVRGTDQKGQKA